MVNKNRGLKAGQRLKDLKNKEGTSSACEYITTARRLSRFAAPAIAAGFLFFLPLSAGAVGEQGPETVYFGMVPAESGAAPVPAPIRQPEISEEDAATLARLLWSSPLSGEDDKRRLCWLVFNRCDDERYGLFGATVETVVIRREFTFYDSKAHLSETNLRIAREELTRWAWEAKGVPANRPLPEGYVYLSFSGKSVSFYREIGGEAWEG